MLLSIIQSWLGPAPIGYEALEYFFTGIFFLLLMRFVIDIFRLIRSVL